MISHLKVDHGISVETISKKNGPIKRDKLKIKKEPTVDPETGEVKSQSGKSRSICGFQQGTVTNAESLTRSQKEH